MSCLKVICWALIFIFKCTTDINGPDCGCTQTFQLGNLKMSEKQRCRSGSSNWGPLSTMHQRCATFYGGL